MLAQLDKTSKKLVYIDAVRGLAILGVMLTHASQYGSFNVPSWLEIPVENGLRGVQLFYVASAFTLFLSFNHRQDKEEKLVRNFFIRRFFRIAPMYYIGILYYLWQDGLGPRFWLGDISHISIPNILSNFLFIHGFNPYWITSLVPGGWSIAVEMIFYAVLPLLFHFIKSLNQALIWFWVSIGISTVLKIILTNNPPIASTELWNGYLYLYFPSQFPVFIAGIIFYFLSTQQSFSSNPVTWISILIISLLLVAELFSGHGFYMQKHIMWAVGFIALLYLMKQYNPIILVNPLTIFIGKISFSLYLCHFAILHWLQYFHLTEFTEEPVVNFSIRAFITIALASVAASFTYRFIELPMQKIGKHLITKSKAMQHVSTV